MLQINGKRRGSLRVPKSAEPGEVELFAVRNELVLRYTNGQPVKKVVVVPGRLVNVVV